MSDDQNSTRMNVSLQMPNQDPLANRFSVPPERCEVNQKERLKPYRAKWRVWMSWHGLSDSDPNSIQAQIHRMLFNDITYRAVVSVRASARSRVRPIPSPFLAEATGSREGRDLAASPPERCPVSPRFDYQGDLCGWRRTHLRLRLLVKQC